MNELTIIKQSNDYPEYYLMRDGEGKLGIYLEGPDEEDPWFLVRDDGMDLEADFETHCDDLAEEARIMIADARAEFGL